MAGPSRSWLQSSSYFHYYSYLCNYVIQLLALNHLTMIKSTGMNVLYQHPLPHLLHALLPSLFLKPPKPSPNSSITLPLLLFLLATSTKAWWSLEIAEAIVKCCKAFARVHCSEEDYQNYTRSVQKVSDLFPSRQ